ncbi:histidine kinase [Actinotalea sp. AC32]|nr:histidine kinase [Actinotalea sp. AC32]
MSRRAWVLPGVLASLLAVLFVTTPADIWVLEDPASGTYGISWSAAMTPWVAAVVLARLSLVVGVVLSAVRPGLATLLGLWPFGLVVVIGWFDWGWWLGLVMIAVVAATHGRRMALAPLLAALAVATVYCLTFVPAMLPVGPVTSGTGSRPEAEVLTVYLGMTVAAVAIAWAIGAGNRSRRRTAEAAVASRRALESESVTAERARIARDLHDVVAHHISLVAVRAESAPYTHPTLGEDARRVLADIATDARGALSELRQVLVVLQRSEGDGAARAPQPGADDVATLVEQARSAGQDVRFTRSGDGAVPPTVGYVLFRAAQEALTNARRHAAGSPVTLDLSADGGLARLRCTNAVGADDDVAPGRGLLGMRERVESVGGLLTVTSRGGVFGVDVVVPTRVGAAPLASAPRAAGATRVASGGAA